MNKVLKQYGWIYLLIPVQIVSALLALMHYGFIFKSGTAAIGILILLLLYLNRQSRIKDIIPLLIAFAFSIVGDWFFVEPKWGDGKVHLRNRFFLFRSCWVFVVCTDEGKREMEIYSSVAYGLLAILSTVIVSCIQ